MTNSSAKIPGKPGKDTIYVDVDDEITAIIDKIEAAKEKVVALVLPKRATVLQSIVNMRLLKRNAEKAGKSVVLITAENALAPLAGAVGLHMAKNLQSKPEVPSAPVSATLKVSGQDDVEELDALDEEPSTKLDYHRAVGELASGKAVDDSEAIALDDEEEELSKEQPPSKPEKQPKSKDKRLKVPNFDRFRVMLFGGSALLIALVVFIILAIFVLPKAMINIQTQSTPVSASLTLNAADSIKTLDEAGNNIPAAVKTIQQTSTQSVPATGQQNNGTKATGTMVFYNCNQADTLSGTNHDVPAGTGVSLNGLTYITQGDAVVPPSHFTGGGTCKYDQASNSVTVTAQAGGAKFNQDGSGGYAVSGYSSSLTGSGSKMTGGTDNNVTVVSQTDLNNAAAKLTDASNSNFTKSFESTLDSQGLYVLVSTLKAGAPTTTANPALGQPATNTTVTTTITYTVLAVQKSDLTKVISDALNKQIDKSKQKLSVDNVLDSATVNVQSQSAPNIATLSVSEQASAVPMIDIASIKRQASGQKAGDIKTMVESLPGVKSVDVHMSPFWVSKAPKPSKIKVVQQQVQRSGS